MAKKNVQGRHIDIYVFPKVIYAIHESDGFIVASKALATLGGCDGEAVGVYELKEVKKLRLRDPELE